MTTLNCGNVHKACATYKLNCPGLSCTERDEEGVGKKEAEPQKRPHETQNSLIFPLSTTTDHDFQTAQWRTPSDGLSGEIFSISVCLPPSPSLPLPPSPSLLPSLSLSLFPFCHFDFPVLFCVCVCIELWYVHIRFFMRNIEIIFLISTWIHSYFPKVFSFLFFLHFYKIHTDLLFFFNNEHPPQATTKQKRRMLWYVRRAFINSIYPNMDGVSLWPRKQGSGNVQKTFGKYTW